MKENTTSYPRTGRPALIALIVSLVICFVVAGAGGLVTATSVGGWYQELNRPPFNPPDWLFPPVWNLLFLMMAIAAWRVWRSAEWARVRVPLGLFFFQLAFNLAWSVLFFGFQEIGLAMADLVILWGFIAATAWQFDRFDRIAAALMIPYLAWVSFAGVLNGYILAAN